MTGKKNFIIITIFLISAFLLPWYQKGVQCAPFGTFDINILGRGYAYFQPAPGEEKETLGETKINLTYSNTFRKGLFFKLSSRLQIDTDQQSEGALDSYKDNDRKRKIFDVNEGFIEHRLGRFDYFLGKRILSWGKGDHFNLSDKINPKDYTDFLDNEKMGILLAGVKLYPTRNSQLEACLIPFFTRSRIQFSDSRWAPCGQGFRIEEDIPDDAMQYASRYSLYLNNLDIDVTYMRKTEDLATCLIVPTPMIGSPDLYGPPGLVAQYRKMNLFSIEGATTMADQFELHAGAAYHDIDKNELYGQFIQYLLGINYTLEEKLPFSKSVKLIGEYLGDIDINKPENKKLIVLDFSRIFENSLFMRITSKLTDFSDFQIGNLFSLEKSFNDILRLEYTYNPNDKLEFKAGLDLIWGDDQLIFEQFEENDRMWISIKYLF
ncbi:MAG: hypothetical protein AB1847_18060 [bacterium]